MSLRSGYSSVFTPVFDTSGSFSGQIDANIPGNLRVGNTGDTYQIYLNGSVFSGGGGGGGGEPSNWANYEATSVVNANLKGLIKVNSINYLPVSINPGGSGSNFAAFGSNAAVSNQTSVATLYAFGGYAGWSNSGDHMYGLGNYAGYRNSGGNLFAAGSNAGLSNGGSNVIAIGRDAGARDNLTATNNVIAIGVSAGYNNKSSDVIAIGNGAGYNNSGNYSIFLGSNPNTTFSNNGDYRFMVYSSNQGQPFMFGDLQNNRLCINGSSFSASNYNFTVNGTTYLDGITQISNTLTIDGGGLRVSNAATFTSTVRSTGILSLTSNLNVSGSSAFTGAVSLQSNLNVSGSLAVQSNSSIGGTLTVPTISSLTTLNGTVNFLTPVGTVTMYIGTTAPTGWLLCDGTSYLRSTYSALSAVIGSNFGGNTTNFNVPDLRSRFPIGVSSTFPINNPSGSLTQTLTTNNIPVHNHGASITFSGTSHSHPITDKMHSHTDSGHTHPYTSPEGSGLYGGSYWGNTAATTGLGYANIQSNYTGITTTEAATLPSLAGTVTVSNSTNANNAFSILNPCIALNYIIKF